MTAPHVRQTVSRQTQKQYHHNLFLVLVRWTVARAMVVVVGVVGVGCLFVCMVSWLGSPVLGVCRCARWLMSTLSFSVRVLGVVVVMGWVGLRSLRDFLVVRGSIRVPTSLRGLGSVVVIMFVFVMLGLVLRVG